MVVVVATVLDGAADVVVLVLVVDEAGSSEDEEEPAESADPSPPSAVAATSLADFWFPEFPYIVPARIPPPRAPTNTTAPRKTRSMGTEPNDAINTYRHRRNGAKQPGLVPQPPR